MLVVPVEVVREAEVFKDQAGREYTAFPYFEPSLNTEVPTVICGDG
jgi:hypothetical protein